MNLITDAWIPVIREHGKDAIAPWQIAETENPVIEINAPRPDFQGALYQFLIGLLQTCFAPEDEDEWLERWNEPPRPEDLKSSFNKVKDAFELDNPEGPAFMQDFDLPDGEWKKIAALLIEAPGGKTIKDNLDHFVKRDQINSLCPSCTATALFTMQTNAPSGGAGHRVGLRGGGPLTTLIRPDIDSPTLWKKLWINVLSKEEVDITESPLDPLVFPWKGPTRLSEKKGDMTTPENAHDLQMYWGMPRRIRLGEKAPPGLCDLCGNMSLHLYKSYRTKKHGVNYDGPWIHPLTPYRFDPKKKELPLSQKGQKGGIGYRHWLGLALEDESSGIKPALIIQNFNNERSFLMGQTTTTRLWCFGYDMDNMKARCWYDQNLPLLYLDKNQKKNLLDWSSELILAARDILKILRDQVKQAWFKRPKDAKGDMSMIDAQFWEATEPDFYVLLEKLAKLPGETRMAPPENYKNWFKVLEKYVFRLFETATLESIPEDLDLKRIVLANQTLKMKFYGSKTIKNLLSKGKDQEA